MTPLRNTHDKHERIDAPQIPASKLVRVRVRVGKRHGLRQCRHCVLYARRTHRHSFQSKPCSRASLRRWR